MVHFLLIFYFAILMFLYRISIIVIISICYYVYMVELSKLRVIANPDIHQDKLREAISPRVIPNLFRNLNRDAEINSA